MCFYDVTLTFGVGRGFHRLNRLSYYFLGCIANSSVSQNAQPHNLHMNVKGNTLAGGFSGEKYFKLNHKMAD